MSTVPSMCIEHDDKICGKCARQNFKYRNLGALAQRVCQTIGCEQVQNGRIANDVSINPFLAGKFV